MADHVPREPDWLDRTCFTPAAMSMTDKETRGRGRTFRVVGPVDRDRERVTV